MDWTLWVAAGMALLLGIVLVLALLAPEKFS